MTEVQDKVNWDLTELSDQIQFIICVFPPNTEQIH